jgi:hypothetical protein
MAGQCHKKTGKAIFIIRKGGIKSDRTYRDRRGTVKITE